MSTVPGVIKRLCFGAVIGGALSLSAGTAQAVTPFQTDVSTAINNGLNYLSSNGVFSNPSSLGVNSAQGVAMEALLEKRASGNPLDPPQGYTGASPADQALLRSAAAYILDQTNETSFYSYRDGAWMFALSGYALTGGPDKSVLAPANPDYQTIKEAMDAIVDRTLANQCTNTPGSCPATSGYNNTYWGYWCYNTPGCRDSSTTQFAAAGLNAARVFYKSNKSADDPFADAVTRGQDRHRAGADPVRSTRSMPPAVRTTRAAACYANRTRPRLPWPAEYNPSLQQTASGIYIQLFGGADVNDSNVQAYMEWIKNHYRYSGSGQHGQQLAPRLLRLLPLEFVQGDGADPSARRRPSTRATSAPTNTASCRRPVRRRARSGRRTSIRRWWRGRRSSGWAGWGTTRPRRRTSTSTTRTRC